MIESTAHLVGGQLFGHSKRREKEMKAIKLNGHSFIVHPRAAAPTCAVIGVTLDDVYATCSTEKHRAYNYCRCLCDDLGGWGFAITSANTFSFCVMFYFEHPETGEIMLAHITPTYNHAYYL